KRFEQHEETIVPVRAPVGGVYRDDAPHGRRAVGPWVLGIGAVLLLVAAIGVFVALPAHVERERAGVAAAAAAAEAAAAQAAAEAAAAAAAEPQLTPEELAALRDEAESLLASVLNQKERLDRQKPAVWAPEAWQRYLGLERDGDDALLADEYRKSIEAYSAAPALGEEIVATSAAIIARALEAGRTALAAGHAVHAIEQLDALPAAVP